MTLNRKPEIPGYQWEEPGDALVQEASYGFCKIQGGVFDKHFIRSKYQQDVMSGASMPDFLGFHPGMQTRLLKQTAELMQTQYGQTDEIGSTLCSLLTWIDPKTQTLVCWTANVGDSFAYFVIIGKDGQVRVANQLNTLHKKDEGSRIQLSLSRAIGDMDQEVNGLTHAPDISHKKLLVEEGDRVFGIVASDGLSTKNKVYKTPALSLDDIKDVVKTHCHQATADIAQALVSAAYQGGHGSTDNIAVGVIAVTNTPIGLVVADGHGMKVFDNGVADSGVKVAQNICDHFYPTLQNNIQYEDKLQQLLATINTLQGDYKALRRKTHNKDIWKLLKAIESINENDALDSREKFEKIVRVIEIAFNKEKDHFCKPFLSIGKLKKPELFIERINTKPSEYHYPRLLGIALQVAYRNAPHFERLNPSLKGVDQIKVVDDKTGIYNGKIIKLLDCEETASFKAYAQAITATGVNLSHTQIYRFYKGQDVLDEKLAVKIWPELAVYGFRHQSLRNLLNGNQTVTFNYRVLSKITNAKQMYVRIKYALGNINELERDEQMLAIKQDQSVETRVRNIQQAIAIIRDGVSQQKVQKNVELKK